VNPSAGLPTGTITFLFTDIEGSTKLLKKLGDRYEESLALHQRVLRDACEAHGGREVDTQGDALFVAFARAKDAIGAALDAQRNLARQDWPEGESVRVRMGMHTAEPLVGSDRYVGLGVHRAARICAAAHGAQIVVSQTTRELLRDDPLPGVSLKDLGEHLLKDLDEPERLYQVFAPELIEDFPPLDTGSSVPFAGREGELAAAAQDTLGAGVPRWRRSPRLLAGVGLALAVILVVLALNLTHEGSSGLSEVGANTIGVVEANGSIERQIPVGTDPVGLAIGHGSIWATNAGGDTVSRIDGETGAVVQTISVGGGPTGIAFGEGSVWVANSLDGTVSRIDSDSNEVVQTSTVGNGPRGLAYGDGSVWVANSADGTVTQIDATTGKVRRTFPAVAGVTDIAVGFNRGWAASSSSASVVVFDTKNGAVLNHVGVGGDPTGVSIGTDSVWVANRADGTVSRIDPAAYAVTDTIGVGSEPEDLSAGGGHVWVANGADGTLSRIDPDKGTVDLTVRVHNDPRGVVVGGGKVYVTVGSTGTEHIGGTTTVVQTTPPDFLDPARSYTEASWEALTMTNAGLVGFRRVGGVQGAELVPDLAESLPVPSSGGKTYTFRVRGGITYSDGTPLEPGDIRRQIERVIEISSPGASYYSGIVGAGACLKHPPPCALNKGIVVDRQARTITFNLTAPDAEFLQKLALPFAYAVPAKAAAKPRALRTVPALGPYMIDTYRGGRSLTLVRNPRYQEWSPVAHPQGFPDKIVFKYGLRVDQQIKMVESGDADYAAELESASPKQLEKLQQRYSSRLHVATREATHYIFFNTRVAPFDHPDVRRAVVHAFDHEELVKRLGPLAAPTCQILPPNLPGYRPLPCDPNEGSIQSIDNARRVIRRSGTAGQRVIVWTFAPFIPATRYYTDLLNTLGYHATLKIVRPPPFDPGLYFTKINDSRTRAQTGGMGWLSDYPSASGFLRPQFTCASFVAADPAFTSNAAEFCDPKVDREILRATNVQAQDPPAATVLWPKIERQILAAAPVLPTFNPRTGVFVSERLGNFQLNPQWGVLVDQGWVK
jgi:peptide/nickel transport system substrate-binding protein